MTKIEVCANYGTGHTTMRLKNSISASRRQYAAAAKRCELAEGDYLRSVGAGTDIVVWDGNRAWAIIAPIN